MTTVNEFNRRLKQTRYLKTINFYPTMDVDEDIFAGFDLDEIRALEEGDLRYITFKL